MTWKRFENAAEEGPMAVFLYALPRLLVAGCVLAAIGVCASLVGFIANPFVQASRIVNKTIDADNVIANYEWFKQRHEDIGAIDRKISLADSAVEEFVEDLGKRTAWAREDREEHSRLSMICLGLKQQRADLAAEYNAKSRMANRSIFKAGDTALPERIEDL